MKETTRTIQVKATRREIEQAARLYRLAVVAHMDLSGDGDQEVREVAIRQSQDDLSRKGYAYQNLATEGACLRAIQEAKK